MEGALEVVLTRSAERKEKDVQRKLKPGPCLDILKLVTKRGFKKT